MCSCFRHENLSNIEHKNMDIRSSKNCFKNEVDTQIFDPNDIYEPHVQVNLKQKIFNKRSTTDSIESETSVQTFARKTELQDDIRFHFLDMNAPVQDEKNAVEYLTDFDSRVQGKVNLDQVAEEDISSVIESKNNECQGSSGQISIQNKKKHHTCIICSKTFGKRSHLVVHLRVHSGVKPYTCNICDKSFTQKINLDRHMFVHIDKKSFECEICKATFRQKIGLIKHKLIHTGVKLYSCNQCDKTFTHKHHLISHTRFHTGEKPYRCYICNVAFSQQTHLRDHNSIHTKEKPYACDLCNKLFALKSHLNRHKKIHNKHKSV